MRKYQHIVGFGMFLIISSIIISISLHLFYNLHKEPEYGNYPAEFTGTFVRIRKEQSRNYYYVLVNYENKIRVMRMFLDKVIIQDTEKKEIQLSDIHTGDTIKVNFLGDIITCRIHYPHVDFVPVSYTHLDVYKRQVHTRTGNYQRIGRSQRQGSQCCFPYQPQCRRAYDTRQA